MLDTCTAAIVAAIVDTLAERADYISAIERNANGTMPITGIAFELSPWHGSIGLSIRLSSDFPLGDSRYESADWPHFDFTADCKSTSISTASALITEIYERGNVPGNKLEDYAHLAFVAGAEALLHPNVCRELQRFGIDAPLLGDGFVASLFREPF